MAAYLLLLLFIVGIGGLLACAVGYIAISEMAALDDRAEGF